jgi:hypothetical protein
MGKPVTIRHPSPSASAPSCVPGGQHVRHGDCIGRYTRISGSDVFRTTRHSTFWSVGREIAGFATAKSRGILSGMPVAEPLLPGSHLANGGLNSF